jgi:sec-independent protein translocase protein TatA
MMRLPGGWEWIIVLVIVLLLFGPGRIGKIAGELGRSIKAFREGLGKDKQDEEQATDSSGNIEPK